MISLAKIDIQYKAAVILLIAVILFWIYALAEPFIYYFTGWGFLYDNMQNELLRIT